MFFQMDDIPSKPLMYTSTFNPDLNLGYRTSRILSNIGDNLIELALWVYVSRTYTVTLNI